MSDIVKAKVEQPDISFSSLVSFVLHGAPADIEEAEYQKLMVNKWNFVINSSKDTLPALKAASLFKNFQRLSLLQDLLYKIEMKLYDQDLSKLTTSNLERLFYRIEKSQNEIMRTLLQYDETKINTTYVFNSITNSTTNNRQENNLLDDKESRTRLTNILMSLKNKKINQPIENHAS